MWTPSDVLMVVFWTVVIVSAAIITVRHLS